MTKRKANHYSLALLAVLLLVVSHPVSAEEKSPLRSSSDQWQFEITPYGMAAGLDGTLGVGRVQGDVGVGFDDILDALEMGWMLAIEARKGSWGFGIDGMYMRVGGEKTKSWQGPGGIGSLTGRLDAGASLRIYQPTLSYRVLDEHTKLDLFGAARYTDIKSNMTLVTTTGPLLPGGTRQISGGEDWWDPVIGTRIGVPFAKKWAFTGYADIGGFGAGADLTYQLMAGVRWQISKLFSLKLAYRYLYQDYSTDNFTWDMAAHGPLLGLGFSF